MSGGSPPSRGKHPLVPPGERVLHDARPSVAYIFVRSLPEVAPAAVVIVCILLLRAAVVGLAAELDRSLASITDVWLGYLLVFCVAYAVARFVWACLDWFCRRYVLTDVRIVAVRGVLHVVRFDVPLRRVQHLAMSRSLLERLFGVGTIAAASAGTGGHEVVWMTVARPDDAMGMVRARIDTVSRRGDGPEPMPVIGLVGGIGSGKSAAAAAFEKLGCVVSDSDKAVREVLMRPEVAEQLVAWWGRGILDSENRVDRKRVADIVFKDDFERRRLESLVHPLVRESRETLIARARECGAKGVVIDAPLLFEAGVDAECDAVVFVETPKDLRLARVRGRGWDEQELDRRENAQMGLEEKRRRSDYVVVNHGTLEELESRVAKVLAAIRKHNRDPDAGSV